MFQRVNKSTFLRSIYDAGEFEETFEEFVQIWIEEMGNPRETITNMIMDRQLTRAGFDPVKVKEIEHKNA